MRGFFKLVLANLTAIFILCAGFSIFFIGFLIISSISEGVDVKQDSVLTLDLKTRIIDSPSEDQDDIFAFNKEKETSVLLYDILQAINKAKTDDKIKGISLEMDPDGEQVPGRAGDNLAVKAARALQMRHKVKSV